MATLTEREYGEKLLHALERPLAEVRMRAVVALGLRAQARAAPALARCAHRQSVDAVEAIAIRARRWRGGGGRHPAPPAMPASET